VISIAPTSVLNPQSERSRLLTRQGQGKSMICQVCGVEAPTKYVAFYQNIGALLMRFSKSIEGNLCKSCIHKHYWGMTGTTFFLGWWGTISVIITPFLILNNTGRYLFCLGMPRVPEGATAPVLTEAAVEKLLPHLEILFERLNAGEDFRTVTESIAQQTGVTPGQVVLFVRAIVEQQQSQQQN
jgi:hypothetical protein